MRKTIIIMAVFLMFSSVSFAATETENLIIPQADSIYNDFYLMANSGLIKSVEPDHFKYSAITSYEAAQYIVEATGNLYAANTSSKASYTAKLRKYYDIYRAKAFEIYGKTMEMRKQIKEIEKILETTDVKEFADAVNDAASEMVDIEAEFEKTTFRGVPPFKVMGMLNARWQDVEAFGVAPAHHTSLGGTYMSLWTEGVVNDDISFKLNLTFERPANEAEKDALPEYWGTGQRFLDKYTINLKAYGWTFSSGFFWEDTTHFVTKQILSERPALFDKDAYALEETSKGHYENAFLHAFIKRGDIWSRHGFMGFEIKNLNIDMGPTKGRFKFMGGKAEQFDEQYDKLFLYEFAGRYTQVYEQPSLVKANLSLNFFKTGNEPGEILTLAPTTPNNNAPLSPDGYFRMAEIYGADLDLELIDGIKVRGEYEIGYSQSYLPKPFDQYLNDPATKADDYLPPKYRQNGSAYFLEAKTKSNMIPMVNLSLKYTNIDPGYVAQASAVIDTAERTVNALHQAEISFASYAGDPTLFYNNTNRVDALLSLELPNKTGFINFNYGMGSQIEPTSEHLYVDHFLFGNRLTGAVWWHLFYSQYGYPVTDRDVGFMTYNDNRHPAINQLDTTYDPLTANKRILYTDKWLTNKELIVLKGVDPDDPNEVSVKYLNNISVEFKLLLSKMLNMKNNLFFQAYGEIATLNAEMTPLNFKLNFDDPVPAPADAVEANTMAYLASPDPNTLFSSNLFTAFIVYNLTRKINLMAVGSIELWKCDKSVRIEKEISAFSGTYEPVEARPLDYFDKSFGFGIDYDFAPRTSLFVRVKRYFHSDLNYPAQDFDGWNIYTEVKNFF